MDKYFCDLTAEEQQKKIEQQQIREEEKRITQDNENLAFDDYSDEGFLKIMSMVIQDPESPRKLMPIFNPDMFHQRKWLHNAAKVAKHYFDRYHKIPSTPIELIDYIVDFNEAMPISKQVHIDDAERVPFSESVASLYEPASLDTTDVTRDRINRVMISVLYRRAMIEGMKLFQDGALDAMVEPFHKASKQAQLLRGDTKYGSLMEYHSRWIQEMQGFIENPIMKLSTGIPELDQNINGGLSRGQLCVIGGMPSAGKSALTLQMSLYAASVGRKVLMYNYEMPVHDVYRRLLAQYHSVRCEDLQEDTIRPETLYKVIQPIPYMDNISLQDANRKLNRSIILQNLREMNSGSAKFQVAPLIIVDYLQVLPHLEGDDKKDILPRVNDNLSILREIAKETDSIILIVSSLNRQAGNVGELSMDCFRESGNIEFNADIALGLGTAIYKDRNKGIPKASVDMGWAMATTSEIQMARQDGGKYPTIKLNVMKNKNNSIGSCLLTFDQDYQRFSVFDQAAWDRNGHV